MSLVVHVCSSKGVQLEQKILFNAHPLVEFFRSQQGVYDCVSNTSNKCHASSNRCLTSTGSNKKIVETISY